MAASESNLTGSYVTHAADGAWGADYFCIDDDLKRLIRKALLGDKRLGPVYADIRRRMEQTSRNIDGPTTPRESFRIDEPSLLLYEMTNDSLGRMCIPAKASPIILRQAYDQLAHQGANRVVDRIRADFYVPGLAKSVLDYVRTCPSGVASKGRHALPYGELQPIKSPDIPFAVQIFDFIVGLPMLRHGCDAVLIVTDKFTK